MTDTIDSTIEALTEAYNTYLKLSQKKKLSRTARTLFYNHAHWLRRRLNRLVIRREAGSQIVHTRKPDTYSSSDSEVIGDGSTTLLKEFDVFDPVDRANEINSWWNGDEQ